MAAARRLVRKEIPQMNEFRPSLIRRRITAVLFDMDGTLLDSEPVYYESEKTFLAGYGIDFMPELKDTFTGRGAVEMFRMLERMFPESTLCRVPSAERLWLKDEACLSLAVECFWKQRGATAAPPLNVSCSKTRASA
jgi:hypothetical protein